MRLRTMAMALVAAAAALLAAGCGSTTSVEEGPVTVVGGGTSTRAPHVPRAAGRRARRADLRRHPWPGVELVLGDRAQRRRGRPAGRSTRSSPTARPTSTASITWSRSSTRPSRPSPTGSSSRCPSRGWPRRIRRAVKAGIPTVTINSGSDVYAKLGVLAHVGQPEEPAGFKAGQRLARAGVRRALCVNLVIPNQGLDARCRGLARAMRAVGGRSRVVRVDDQSPAAPQVIAKAVRSTKADGVLAMNSLSGLAAVKGADGPAACRSRRSTWGQTCCARCSRDGWRSRSTNRPICRDICRSCS